MRAATLAIALLLAIMISGEVAGQASAAAQPAARAVDIATRPGVTQRFLLIEAAQPRAVVVLFAGGEGSLRLAPDGGIGSRRNNFLVRSGPLFVDQGLSVALFDAPSDRQRPPYLGGWRQSPEHAEDVRLLMAWLRQNLQLPVWLIGTSRGTQSVAAVVTRLSELDPKAPNADGIVLTSTILTDDTGRPVPAMPLERLTMPVLVMHHEQDGCRHCRYSDMPALMSKLTGAARKELLTYRGGENVGDPCEALAYHGFNGLEKELVAAIAAWIR